MSRRNTYLRLSVLAIGLLLIFIWGNSLMPGPVSQAISNLVRDLLLGGHTPAGTVPPGSGILRKAAHFTEFTALGMALAWRCRLLGRKSKTAFFQGAAAAFLDETIQFFVPERAARVLDLGIDSLGVLTGIALVSLGHTYLKKRSANN